jgi:hypothetical protein
MENQLAESAVTLADTGAIYLVCDRRHDGRMRIVAQYREPSDALAHAVMLRWAGSPAEVLIAAAQSEQVP